MYVGFEINSSGPANVPWIKVTKNKLQKLKKTIRRALKRKHIQARALAMIAGMCVAMMRAILPAKLKLRNVYRLLAIKCSWSDVLFIEGAAEKDLQWWLEALHSRNGAPIFLQTTEIQVATDASSSGWGGVVRNSKDSHLIGQSASGMWSETISWKPSNYRELLAIIVTLKSMSEHLVNKHVQIISNNISAVAYLNHMGGPSPELSTLAQSLWAVCYKLNVTVTAKYLAESLNQDADYLSRLLPSYEWQLNPRLFKFLDQIYGPHTVDQFASMMTTHLPHYNSRFLDPVTVDNKTFCELPILNDCQSVKVIQNQQAEATVIAPLWPSQPWFKRIQQMSQGFPIKLPNPLATYLPHSRATPEPLRNPKWKIYAWRVSGKPD